MATKTISLELDAYEKLRAAKISERESFSSVVRRAEFRSESYTGAAVLESLKNMSSCDLPDDEVFEHWARMRKEDLSAPRISASRWGASDAS